MTGRIAACAYALCLAAQAAAAPGPDDPGAGSPPGPLAQAGGAASGSSPRPDTAGGGYYGPVRPGDTLRSLAARLRPDDSVSVRRMMAALLEANPRAFTGRDLGTPVVGSTLRIPTRDEIGTGGARAAIGEARRRDDAGGRVREPDPAPPSAPAPAASGPAPQPDPPGGGSYYGPVRPSDTLWSLAARLRPDDSVSVQRMMLALLEANPRAFTIRNVNAVIVGATLRVPARHEIGPDDKEAAIAEIRHHNAVWKKFRESLGLREAPASILPFALPVAPPTIAPLESASAGIPPAPLPVTASSPPGGPAGGDAVRIA